MTVKMNLISNEMRVRSQMTEKGSNLIGMTMRML
jgi:hypothetical protein